MRIFSSPFLASHCKPRPQPRPQGLLAFAILESEKTLGTRIQRMRSFWSAPRITVGDSCMGTYIVPLLPTRITKMAARALHRVCCSAGYCQVSRHVSSLFRLQMTNTLLKDNKGFQIFYRGFFVSKGLWRSLHGIKNKQRGYKLCDNITNTSLKRSIRLR